MRNWRRMQSSCYQSGKVCHIHKEVGSDFVRDFTEASKIELTRVGRPTCNDHLRLMFTCQSGNFVHIDFVCCLIDRVGHDVVQTTREVQLHAVCEVTTMSKVEAHDRIARTDQSVHNG